MSLHCYQSFRYACVAGLIVVAALAHRGPEIDLLSTPALVSLEVQQEIVRGQELEVELALIMSRRQATGRAIDDLMADRETFAEVTDRVVAIIRDDKNAMRKYPGRTIEEKAGLKVLRDALGRYLDEDLRQAAKERFECELALYLVCIGSEPLKKCQSWAKIR